MALGERGWAIFRSRILEWDGEKKSQKRRLQRSPWDLSSRQVVSNRPEGHLDRPPSSLTDGETEVGGRASGRASARCGAGFREEVGWGGRPVVAGRPEPAPWRGAASACRGRHVPLRAQNTVRPSRACFLLQTDGLG